MEALKESLKLDGDLSTIWRISWPVIVSSGALTFVNITDAKFLGAIGEQEIGAASLAGNIFFIYFMVAQALGVGTQILIARYAGQENIRSLYQSFFTSLQIQSIVSVGIFILSLFVLPIVIKSAYGDDRVMSLTTDYLVHRAWGIFPTFIAMAYRSYFTGIGYTKIIMWAAIATAFLNIPLDYLLIHGYGVIPAYGIKGAAHASALAEVVGLFVLLFAAYRNDFMRIPSWCRDYIARNKESWKELLNLSMPLVLQFLVANTSWFLFFILIQKVGDFELAVSSIGKHLLLFLMVPTWGFAGAANTITSNLLGQNRRSELKVFSLKIAGFSFLCALLIASGTYFGASSIVSFFSEDPSLLNESAQLLRFITIFILIGSLSCVLYNILTGTGDTKTSMKIEVVTILFYLVYCFVFLHFNYVSLYIAWGSEIVYWGCLGLMSFVRLKMKHW